MSDFEDQIYQRGHYSRECTHARDAERNSERNTTGHHKMSIKKASDGKYIAIPSHAGQRYTVFWAVMKYETKEEICQTVEAEKAEHIVDLLNRSRQ